MMSVMPELIDPSAGLRLSFRGAVEEFRSDPDYLVPWFVHDVDAQALVDPEAFGRYVARVLRERAQVDGRSGFVAMTRCGGSRASGSWAGWRFVTG